MPEHLHFPWVSVSLLALIAAAVACWSQRSADRARIHAAAVLSGVSVMLLAASADAGRGVAGHLYLEPWSGALPEGWFGVDALNAVALPVFAVVMLGVAILAPRRKVTPQWLSGILILAAATISGYAAENLVVLAVAWAVSAVPFLIQRFFSIPDESEVPQLSRLALVASVVCVAAGAYLLAVGRGVEAISWGSAHPSEAHATASGRLAFWLLMLAVVLRKGLVPVHSWIVTAFDRGPMLPLMLLLNGHLGAFLVARVVLPLLPDLAREWVRLLGDLGLFTAAYTALLALVETRPRRILALLSISQASFVWIGLYSRNVDGITGALVHLQVVSVATTVLACVLTGLEARVGKELDNTRYLGLAAVAPRLAVFFLLGGLPLVGLPLTLGFCGEDLLLHGTLATHPHLGYIMPSVTAINAFSVVRLFARLFLGQPGTEIRGMSDALPRERWVLTAAVLFLVLGGLFPSYLLHLPTAAAERLTVPAAPQGLHARAER